MRIPFDIKYRPQIESGEYKVVLDCGVEAEILAWDKLGEYPIVCMAKKEGAIPFRTDNKGIAYHYPEGSNYSDLFIITPEPELSEFEERIFKLLRQYKECDIPLTPENIKAEASMLWPDLEKYFFDLYGKEGEGDSALRSFYYRGLEDGKAEALKGLPRWKKAKENIEIGSDDFCFTLDNDGKMDPYWGIEVKKGQYYITESDIENLPKED